MQAPLPPVTTVEDLCQRIHSLEFKHVIIFSGAGVSTGCGIPDYRSPGGTFQQLVEQFPGYDPTRILTRAFMAQHDLAESPLFKQLQQEMASASPGPSHHLAAWLNSAGILQRVYTQNVDGLYQKAGVFLTVSLAFPVLSAHFFQTNEILTSFTNNPTNFRLFSTPVLRTT